ncbi:MAG: MoaD/ThiS family protein [Kouleothrix sp.]|jgi:molybdopterin synthase sulfur carrier subunit|nr:MoaD/ThiS family protein [Kouleothrix sp.]
MQINFYATLRQIVGGRTVTFDMEPGITVRELIDGVVTRFPPLRVQLLDNNGNLYSHVHVFINGRDAPYLPNSVETTIAPGDTIDIFPATAGG